MEEIIKRLLNHSYKDIDWDYEKLTKEEKLLMSPEEFETLKDKYEIIELKKMQEVIFTVDYHDFEKFVEKAYGGSFEIVAIEEKDNYSSFKFEVGGTTFSLKDEKLREKIRSGNYPTYCTSEVVECLIEDGYLKDEGQYVVDISW